MKKQPKAAPPERPDYSANAEGLAAQLMTLADTEWTNQDNMTDALRNLITLARSAAVINHSETDIEGLRDTLHIIAGERRCRTCGNWDNDPDTW
jgi:hypothetical protein